eukprot:SAG31_NODE_283_length_18512_cov_19.352414_11_plen_86_part_00
MVTGICLVCADQQLEQQQQRRRQQLHLSACRVGAMHSRLVVAPEIGEGEMSGDANVTREGVWGAVDESCSWRRRAAARVNRIYIR